MANPCLRSTLIGAHPRGTPCSLGRISRSEATQNLLCAYLSVALLAGLVAKAMFGWCWADPGAALVIAGVAAREGVEGWKGEACCEE